MKATMAGAPEVIRKLMSDKARNLRAWDLAGDSESPGLPVYMSVAVAVSAWQGRGPEDLIHCFGGSHGTLGVRSLEASRMPRQMVTVSTPPPPHPPWQPFQPSAL